MTTVTLNNGTSLGPTPQRIRRQIGGNLFRIALEELGDATQAGRIADLNHHALMANGFVDFWVQGSQALQIPPILVQSTDTGALPVITHDG
jgi:hypothetical protein